MRNLMDKINHFETLPVQCVVQFNEVFESKLTDLSGDLEVEIGALADSETTRFLTVGSLIVKHNFTPRVGSDKLEEI